jgi:putative transposase
MLELVRLRHLFQHHGTPPAGQKLIEEARRRAPVRKVRSNSNNVITRFASRKMERLVDTESRTVEYPAVIMYEHDAEILEYYAQPTALDLKWKGPNDSRPSRIQHTPDFLLIRKDGFWIEEWREEERLVKLSAKNPERIFKDNGEWRFLPIEEHLRSLGIGYRLRSADEHPRIFIQNLIFLADYLDPKWPAVEGARLAAIQGQFQDRAAIPLLHLLDRGRSGEPGKVGEDGFTSDDVYKAIADGDLCFDLKDELLSDTHRVLIYRDESAWELGRTLPGAEVDIEQRVERRDVSIDPGSQVDYDGVTYTVVRVGAKTATLQNGDSTFDHEVAALVDKHQRGLITIHATNDEVPRALASFENLPQVRVDEILIRKAVLDQAELDPASAAVSDRTLRRYRAMVRKAGENAVDQRIALASRIGDRGNRERKIPQRIIELVGQVADEHYNDARNMSKTTAYKYFLEACEKEGLLPCSMMSSNKELELSKSVRSRKGKRAEYQEAPIVWYLKLTEPVHGVRPFQYVHIDHTQLDIQLVSAETRKVLGKPWLTLAVDAESREVVGFYLSFEAPSYRSCMMVVRDIVRRNGQMPAMLVLDNGKEFHSRALARVCELYGCSLRFRPSGKPRYGSVMERLFGTTNDQFIHQLEGNTQLMKNPWSVTKAVLPEHLAAWTLPQLHGALESFFKLYGSSIHPAHGESPTEHFKRRLAETGERQHRLVRIDEVFLIETCPPPADTPTRKVDGQRGVKIRHLWFWDDVLARPEVRNQEVEVRVDPWDPGTAFALVKGRWVACRSKLYPILSRYTEVERRYLFEELAKQVGGKIGSLKSHRLAEWLRILEPKNFDSKLSEQQAQGKAIYGALGMTQAAPAKQPAPEPKVVVPLKPTRTKAPLKPEKPVVRRSVTPLEVDTDDYSLL